MPGTNIDPEQTVNEWIKTDVSHQQKRKKLIPLIFWYALPFILIDIVVVILWSQRFIGIFRTILFIYISNVVLLPFMKIAGVLWKILAKKIKRPGSKRAGNLDIREIVVNIGFSFLLLSIFVYATLIEPQNIQVDEITILSDKVADEVKILHISDIQSNSVGQYEHKVFELIRKLNPGLILHTGDLVQTGSDLRKKERENKKLAALFKQLRPKYGIYHVIGDTDWPQHLQGLPDALSGVKTLIDQNQVVRDNAVKFHILGLSLGKSRRGDKRFIEQWKNRSNEKAFTIVMGHAPDYISDIIDLDIDLCIAGHTHGGQIRIPYLGPLLTFSRIPKAWAMGYREVGKTRMNVSAGIGAEHAGGLPAIRINCPPTMTLFTIKNPQ